MTATPSSFAEVICLWPRVADLAADLDLPWDTVRQWKLNGSIPAAHWAATVSAATVRGFPVTLALLAELAAQGRATLIHTPRREPNHAA